MPTLLLLRRRPFLTLRAWSPCDCSHCINDGALESYVGAIKRHTCKLLAEALAGIIRERLKPLLYFR